MEFLLPSRCLINKTTNFTRNPSLLYYSFFPLVLPLPFPTLPLLFLLNVYNVYVCIESLSLIKTSFPLYGVQAAMAARKGGLSGNSPEQDLNRQSLNSSPPLFDVDPPAAVILSRDSSRSNGRRPKPSTPPPPLPVEQSDQFSSIEGNANNSNFNNTSFSSGPATSREDSSDAGVIGSGSMFVTVAVLGTGSAVIKQQKRTNETA